MKGNSPDSNLSSFLLPSLKEQLDPKHPIYQLNDRINWSAIDEDFKELYSHKGHPAKSVRLMVSVMNKLFSVGLKIPTRSFCVERLNFSGDLQQPPQT